MVCEDCQTPMPLVLPDCISPARRDEAGTLPPHHSACAVSSDGPPASLAVGRGTTPCQAVTPATVRRSSPCRQTVHEGVHCSVDEPFLLGGYCHVWALIHAPPSTSETTPSHITQHSSNMYTLPSRRYCIVWFMYKVVYNVGLCTKNST